MSLGEMNQPESRNVFMRKQSWTIYTAMLFLALLFIIIGCAFMFAEWSTYKLSTKVSPDAKVPAAMWSPLHESSLVALDGSSTAMDCLT
jgi:hypothetical protein